MVTGGELVVLQRVAENYAPQIAGAGINALIKYAEIKRKDDNAFKLRMAAMNSHYSDLDKSRNTILQSRKDDLGVISDLIGLAKELGDKELALQLVDILKEHIKNAPDYLNAVTGNSLNTVHINES